MEIDLWGWPKNFISNLWWRRKGTHWVMGWTKSHQILRPAGALQNSQTSWSKLTRNWMDLMWINGKWVAPAPSQVHAAISPLQRNRAPGPNGFSEAFFYAAWNAIGSAIINTAQHFFLGRPLGASNTCMLTQIPSKFPSNFFHFRPLNLLNSTYKIISFVSTRERIHSLSLFALFVGTDHEGQFVSSRVRPLGLFLEKFCHLSWFMMSGPPPFPLKSLAPMLYMLHWVYILILEQVRLV